MGTPFYQSLNPDTVPDPVTPADSPGDPRGYGMVSPSGRGTAPYDVQADLSAIQDDITSVTSAAYDVSAAGIVAPQGARQKAIETLLDSPQGFSAGGGTSGYDVPQGWTGEPDDSFINNAQPTTILETPIQGQMGSYPVSNTYQDGVPKYGA